jgi:hypothetical protein
VNFKFESPATTAVNFVLRPPRRAAVELFGSGGTVTVDHCNIRGGGLFLAGSAAKVTLEKNLFTGGGQVADMDEVGEFNADGNEFR